MTEVGFPCAITFYSISGNFDKILLKIAFNTNIKYILKLIIKKLAVEKMHSNGYICGKFYRNDAQNVYYSSDIQHKTLENSFLSYQYDFLLWHATR